MASEASAAYVQDPEKALDPAGAARRPSISEGEREASQIRQTSSSAALHDAKQNSTWTSRFRLRKGKPPLLLKLRSAEWLIQLCVGFGVFVDLCSK